MSDGSLTRYARAIERRWSEFLERPAVLSPGDWRWINEWHDRGIPLELIVECVEAAKERRREGRGAKRPRGLSYLATAVEESWSVILDGQVPSVFDEVVTPADPRRDAWRGRVSEEPERSRLRALLERLLADLDAGADPERLEAKLDDSLRDAVSAEQWRAAETEARDWLEPHRSRISVEEFESAVRRAAVVRLRRRLRLPRLV